MYKKGITFTFKSSTELNINLKKYTIQPPQTIDWPTPFTSQMDKLTFAKINDPIDSVDPTQQQVPAEMFRPLTGKDAEQMLTDLSRPINFR